MTYDKITIGQMIDLLFLTAFVQDVEVLLALIVRETPTRLLVTYKQDGIVYEHRFSLSMGATGATGYDAESWTRAVKSMCAEHKDFFPGGVPEFPKDPALRSDTPERIPYLTKKYHMSEGQATWVDRLWESPRNDLPSSFLEWMRAERPTCGEGTEDAIVRYIKTWWDHIFPHLPGR